MSVPLRKQPSDPADIEPGGHAEAVAILWRIPCSCCGGPVIIDDATRVITCEYCGEPHLLDRSQPVVHFVKPTVNAEEAVAAIKRWLRDKGHRATSLGATTTVLVPYWRYFLRVLRFTGGGGENASGASTDLFTTMIPAIREAELVPIPVGPAPEITECCLAMPYLIPPETLVVPVTGDEEAARRLATDAQNDAFDERSDGERACNLEQFVSVFYRPFYMLRYSFRSEHFTVVCCAITGRVTGRAEGDLVTRVGCAEPAAALQHTALPAQHPLGCPDCGKPIVATETTAVYGCKHCEKLWSHTGAHLRETRSLVASGDGIPLPFWRVTCVARSSRDPEQQAGSMGPWTVYVPAFQPCPSGLLRRLSTNMTLALPRYDERSGLPTAATECRLGSDAAGKVALLVLSDPEFAARSADAPLPEAVCEVDRCEVVWIPFRSDRGFLNDAVTGTAISEGVFGD